MVLVAGMTICVAPLRPPTPQPTDASWPVSLAGMTLTRPRLRTHTDTIYMGVRWVCGRFLLPCPLTPYRILNMYFTLYFIALPWTRIAWEAGWGWGRIFLHLLDSLCFLYGKGWELKKPALPRILPSLSKAIQVGIWKINIFLSCWFIWH